MFLIVYRDSTGYGVFAQARALEEVGIGKPKQHAEGCLQLQLKCHTYFILSDSSPAPNLLWIQPPIMVVMTSKPLSPCQVNTPL